MKFDFIVAEKAQFKVQFMCRMLGVSPSCYYAWRKRKPCNRVLHDQELTRCIRAEFAKYPRGCGSRTAMGGLRAAGYRISRKRVVRLMAHENLRCRLKRRFVRTTLSTHNERLAPNKLNRSFEPGAPNRFWASDITYIHTKQGWTYLAVILDLGSRKVVGWNVATTMAETLTLSTLRQV